MAILLAFTDMPTGRGVLRPRLGSPVVHGRIGTHSWKVRTLSWWITEELGRTFLALEDQSIPEAADRSGICTFTDRAARAFPTRTTQVANRVELEGSMFALARYRLPKSICQEQVIAAD